VVEDVDIQLLAAQHGFADGQIDIGIVPRIEGIQRRTSAEQCGHHHSKKEQKHLFARTYSYFHESLCQYSGAKVRKKAKMLKSEKVKKLKRLKKRTILK